jgi:DNA-binding response OmpR family regulator
MSLDAASSPAEPRRGQALHRGMESTTAGMGKRGGACRRLVAAKRVVACFAARFRGGLERSRHPSAVVEIGANSADFLRALARALRGIPVLQADSIDAACRLSSRVILFVGAGADPVAPIQSCKKELRSRVIVACERADGSEVARWARAGVTNCFVGLESLAELHATVRASADDESFDVLLDASDLAIDVAGARTRLTKTQFRLLQHLSSKRGHWVTASELVKQVLGTHHENEAALVRVHIHAIRRALGPLACLVETDPGRARGYRFRNDPVKAPFSAKEPPPPDPSS